MNKSASLFSSRFVQNICVFAIYGIITLVVTYPWLFHFTTHSPDWGGEGSMGLWNLWHFGYGLRHGTPFETDLLLPPYHLNLVYHTYTISRDIFAIPLMPFLGLVLTSNLLTLFSFALSGLGIWLLIREITGDSKVALVAGLVYVFSPYRFAHLSGHYQLISIEWLPFYTLYLIRYIKSGSRHHLILAALFALLTSLTDYYYGMFLIVLSALIVLHHLVFLPEKFLKLKRFTKLAGAALIIHLPFIGLLIWGWQRSGWVGRPVGQEMLKTLSADLISFITPSIQHPLFGKWVQAFSQDWNTHFAEHTIYLGILPILFAILVTFNLKHISIDRRFWIYSFWFFLTLSLGPALHWKGRELFTLPYEWFGEVPLFREVRAPSRWVIMSILALSVVSGQALSWAVIRWSNASRLVMPIVAFVILFEYFPAPLTLADRSVPSVYFSIAQDPQKGSVLDLPFGANDSFTNLGGWNPQAMYFQTVTSRPIVGAHISRIPGFVFDGYSGLPIIERLIKIENGGNFTDADVRIDQLHRNDLVILLDLRYIVIPEWYFQTRGADYILGIFDGCLDEIPGDGRSFGYLVRRTC